MKHYLAILLIPFIAGCGSGVQEAMDTPPAETIPSVQETPVTPAVDLEPAQRLTTSEAIRICEIRAFFNDEGGISRMIESASEARDVGISYIEWLDLIQSACQTNEDAPVIVGVDGCLICFAAVTEAGYSR